MKQTSIILAMVAGALIFAPTLHSRERRGDKADAFAPVLPEAAEPPPANGAIFQPQAGYAPLTSGNRAARVGDVLTIILRERTAATKSNSASTERDGGIGLTPPPTGPLSFFSPSDVNISGTQSFNGSGQAAQSNALSGEVTVTVAQVFANGSMLVRGEKLLELNRGDERIQLSGIVRPADISPENTVVSTRVGNAKIHYVGKGEIARASKQGWLQRFFSLISPF